MSCYHSDKCTKEELNTFKQEVIAWLNSNFPNWNNKFKLKSFTCYNGDIRLYDGSYMEIPNKKSTFRRTEADKDENGKIIGYSGLRGHHITRYSNYISINRDEFEEIKQTLNDKKSDNYFYYEDLIFIKLVCQK